MSVKLMDLEPERRDAVLNAALKEFVLRGFDKASTNVIAKEAGMSKALMFHYVKGKQELFLLVYDYFTELFDREYFRKMDFSQKDIFDRLRSSYLLQMELIRQYPWIFELDKLSLKTNSELLNKKLEERVNRKQASYCGQIFKGIDESRFRKGLDIEKCRQIIYWANVGFTNQLLEDIRQAEADISDDEAVRKKIDEYFGEFRKIFYVSDGQEV